MQIVKLIFGGLYIVQPIPSMILSLSSIIVQRGFWAEVLNEPQHSLGDRPAGSSPRLAEVPKTIPRTFIIAGGTTGILRNSSQHLDHIPDW